MNLRYELAALRANVLMLGAVIRGFYLAPTLIAENRRLRSVKAIRVVNIVTGWTIIGWMAAFWWATRERALGSNEHESQPRAPPRRRRDSSTMRDRGQE